MIPCILQLHCLQNTGPLLCDPVTSKIRAIARSLILSPSLRRHTASSPLIFHLFRVACHLSEHDVDRPVPRSFNSSAYFLMISAIFSFLSCVNVDVVHNLESSLFSHGLDLADDLADKAFLEQLRCQVVSRTTVTSLSASDHIALRLRHIDQQIILCESDSVSVEVRTSERPSAFSVIHGCVAVHTQQESALMLPSCLPYFGPTVLSCGLKV